MIKIKRPVGVLLQYIKRWWEWDFNRLEKMYEVNKMQHNDKEQK